MINDNRDADIYKGDTMIKFLVCSFVMGIALTACNTMEGVGKDVKSAGSSLENAANKNKS